jgi:hypothetical protein
MLETDEALRLDERLGIRVGKQSGDDAEGIVLLGKTIWRGLRGDGLKRYGIAFLSGQGESYGRLRRFEEVLRARSLADALGLMFVEVTPSMIEKRALGYLGKDLAFSQNCIPIKLRGERLMVAMAEPDEPSMLKKLQLLSQCEIVPVVATPSAIRDALVQCWGPMYVPSRGESPEAFPVGSDLQERTPRMVVLVSDTSHPGGKRLGENLVSVFNRDGRHAVITDSGSYGSIRFDMVSHGGDENLEWRFLSLPMDGSAPGLAWVIRADEVLLVVSPSNWQEGCLYVETVFDRFVQVRKSQSSPFPIPPGKRRILEISVVCIEIPNMRQGFTIFRQMEERIHHRVDMKNPGVDVVLYYLGGILRDEKNLRKAEKAHTPITILKPNALASQCMVHVARSLLRPTPERDPRVYLSRSPFFRLFR